MMVIDGNFLDKTLTILFHKTKNLAISCLLPIYFYFVVLVNIFQLWESLRWRGKNSPSLQDNHVRAWHPSPHVRVLTSTVPLLCDLNSKQATNHLEYLGGVLGDVGVDGLFSPILRPCGSWHSTEKTLYIFIPFCR